MSSHHEQLHEQLWAPWRLAYIADSVKEREATKKTNPDCFLCAYNDDAENDAENYVVAREATTLVVLNRYPYNNGHLLVAPKRHVAAIDELTSDETLHCQLEIARMIQAISKVMKPDGFNVGLNIGRVAGAGLPGHLHWHIVPRWAGDTNFMPVLSDVRVIPQSLSALHQLLVEAL